MKATIPDPTDETLVADAVAGSRRALNTLLRRHQDYIYNIALRLFLHPDDALDATQEVLLKVVTHLKTFGGKSQFRTWLYRIVVNHFLNSPARRYERLFDRGAELSALADTGPSAWEREVSEAEVEEVRVSCSTAMLLCLSRDQRLLYVIGEIFGADHTLGATLFGLTPGNYRVRLHRAKADLLNYVSGKCGLLDPRNPCRCPKKAKALVQQGLVDPARLLFHQHYTQKVAQLVEARKDEVSDEIQLHLQGLFRDSPYQVRTELDDLFNSLLGAVDE
ncbi:RNA polymerase sigma factor [Hymenobacter sp. BT664]|uniref:RNA polymerase sigma factor n=1 Tax=Hymenobacter montanus TaxID=2771359 RepID=A0A927GHG5_9BACT|nr:RNA polymerase sigma factor [Hymenobacter montanus]MBD2766388.1 RNA polymerase sigma factor [Hymenobacter montanus]